MFTKWTLILHITVLLGSCMASLTDVILSRVDLKNKTTAYCFVIAADTVV